MMLQTWQQIHWGPSTNQTLHVEGLKAVIKRSSWLTMKESQEDLGVPYTFWKISSNFEYLYCQFFTSHALPAPNITSSRIWYPPHISRFGSLWLLTFNDNFSSSLELKLSLKEISNHGWSSWWWSWQKSIWKLF